MLVIDPRTLHITSVQPQIPAQPVTSLADRYARLHAAHSQLGKELEETKALIVASGASEILGQHHRLVITQCAGKRVTDWKGIATSQGIPQTVIESFTSLGKPYSAIQVFGI